MTSSPAGLRIIKFSVLCLGIYNVCLWLFSDMPLGPRVPSDRHYTYIGSDFPHTFPMSDEIGSVNLITEDTAHYNMVGEHATAEWASLIPNTDGFIYLGPRGRPFIITMFHTIHCLNKMRLAITATPPTESLRYHAEHCFNYVRQMTLCAVDTRLQPLTENVLQTTGSDGIDGLDLKHTCRDWSAVYRAAENNQKAWIDSGRHWEDFWNEYNHH